MRVSPWILTSLFLPSSTRDLRSLRQRLILWRRFFSIRGLLLCKERGKGGGEGRGESQDMYTKQLLLHGFIAIYFSSKY